MNRLHRWYCRSNHWRRTLEGEVLPWALAGVALGDTVLEVGPGPGLTTDWLLSRCRNLTCIEMDLLLANALGRRTAHTNVHVHCGDATAMSFPDWSFSTVVCFTVLHHVPSTGLQDRLFSEVYRVLRPGGTFAGTDSMNSLLMQFFHFRDTLVPVDPMNLPARLESIGFSDVEVEIGTGRFRFRARRAA